MNPALFDTSDILTRLQSPDFAPELRSDVEFISLPDRSGVRLSYDGGRRWVDLAPLDCLIAQQLDGTRPVAWLIQFVRQYDRSVDRATIEQLLVELSARGLIVEPMPPPPAPKEGKIVPLPTRRPHADEYAAFRDDIAEVFSDDTTVDWHGVGGVGSMRSLGEARPFGAAPEPEPEDEAEQEPEPEQEQEIQPDTPEKVEAEQEALWDDMRAVKWHHKRRYRVLLVLGAFVLLAAVIPYPLKITSEAVIVPTERAYVRSTTAGIIAEIRVDEAQAVKKGQVLARLDDRELKTEQRKAAAEIERIRSDIHRLKRGARPEEIAGQRAAVAAAANEVAFARREAARKGRMAREGVGSVQAREQAEHEFRVKQKALAEASAGLRLLRAGSRKEDIEGREAELDRASAQLAYVEEQLELTMIRAPIDGVLLTPKFRERLAEKIDAGGLLCQIAKTDRMRAEIYLAENDMDSVAVGQEVVVKVQSYPTREFTGKVDFLAPTVEKRGDQNRVRVVAELANLDGALKQDMTGYGEINSGSRTVLNLVTRRVLRWVRVRFLL